MKEKGMYRAAFSQISITPDYQTTLIGRYRPDNSQGVLHKLYAQVLLFQSEDDTFCLIAIDSLGLTVSLAKVIRDKVADMLHVDVSHVMLNFSHTHSAPAPMPPALNGEKYFDFLCKQITTCVEAATAGFRACKIGWALTTADIGENRRDGCTITDNRLGALMVADAENDEPIALVFRISTHNNILPAENHHISNDFIGVAREELQRITGFPIMFLQGAAGNIKAVGTNRVGEGSDDVLRNVADILIDSVKALRFELRDIYDMQMTSREITCTADAPTKEEAEALAADDMSQDVRNWVNTCDDLRKQGIYSQSLQVEINFLKINEGGMCGVAEEIFCELAIEVQKRANNPLLFFNGYTNGSTLYLPSRAEHPKRGWETLYSYFSYHQVIGRVMPYRAETADRIVDLVVSEWEKL